jgi:hypothetical protein
MSIRGLRDRVTWLEAGRNGLNGRTRFVVTHQASSAFAGVFSSAPIWMAEAARRR